MKRFKQNLLLLSVFVLLSGTAQSAVFINETHVNASCYNGNTGSIDITAFGGTAPYTYLWNNLTTSEDRQNLTAGSYTVTVTDMLASTTSLTITITEPVQMNVTLIPIPVTCHGGTNGAINTTTTGGTGPYSYLWNNGAFTQNRIGLATGNYSITVTDFNGCTATATVFVPQPLFALNATVIPSPLACIGGPSGSVMTSVTGGTPPYTYWWGAGVIDSARWNLFAGNYCVTATDANGCTTSSCATIPAYIPLNISSAQTNNICYYDSIGSINIVVTNGSTPYTYVWNSGQVTEDINQLKAGAYTVTVTDNHTCTALHSVTITQPTFPITINTTAADLSCYGTDDGSLGLSVLNGIFPYTYTWGDTSLTTPNRTALIPGNYSVTITDNNACTATSSTTIVEPTQLVVIPTAFDVACFEDSTGAINLAATGSFAPYDYDWSDGGDTQNRTDLPAGNYTVLLVDNHGCTASASATISQPLAPVTISSVIGNVSCFGGNDGWINLTATGGTSPYTYDWGGSVVSQNINNLIAGTYPVTVVDSAGCSYYANPIVNQPAAILISSVVTNVTCAGWNNGAINLTVTGGTAPYTFAWNDGSTTQNRTNLTPGSDTVTVTDFNGCTATHIAVISQSSTLSISAVATNATCNAASNGTITVTVNNGIIPYTFAWNDGITTQNRVAVPAGNYFVTVTDANTCTAATSATINEPSPIIASTTAVNPTCFGSSNGSIDLTVSGGTGTYVYSWSNSATTQNLNTVPAGNFLVNITDQNNCVVSITATITQPSAITLSTTQTNVGCNPNSGAIDLTVAGGTFPYTFNWSNSAVTEDISSLAIGNYSLIVRDTNFCSATKVVNIIQAPAFTITETHADISCYGANDGSIDITSNGGNNPYTYDWGGSVTGSNRTNLLPGIYSVTVTDITNCSASISTNITEPPLLSLTTTQTDVVCNGTATGSIDLAVNGGTANYSYLWSNTSINQDISGIAAGNYSVVVTDARNCSASTSTTMLQSPAIQTSLSKTDATCFGSSNGSINLSLNNGITPYTFVWSNGALAEDLNNIPAGLYSVVVTDANNCSVNNLITVNQPASIQANPQISPVSCFGGSNGKIDLSVNGGASSYNFIWNNSSVTEDIYLLRAGNYSVTITDATGCSALFSNIIVSQPTALNVLSNVVPVSCFNHNNGEIDLDVSGGVSPYSYQWSNTQSNSRSIANLAMGYYSATINDQNGCITNAVENVGIAPPMVLTSSAKNTACEQVQTGAVDITVNGGTPSYNFNWSNGSNNEDISNISDGTYTITVTDSRDCSIEASFIISFDYDLTVDATATPSSSIKAGETLQLTATSNTDHGNIYSWSTSQNIICASCNTVEVTPIYTTLYTLATSDINGCKATDTITVEVNSTNNIFIPNVFTPNSDGNNDILQLCGDKLGIKFLDFSVFNRWGEQVFESSDPNFKWDGTYKGDGLPQGAYVYRMKVGFITESSSNNFSGSITILR